MTKSQYPQHLTEMIVQDSLNKIFEGNEPEGSKVLQFLYRIRNLPTCALDRKVQSVMTAVMSPVIGVRLINSLQKVRNTDTIKVVSTNISQYSKVDILLLMIHLKICSLLYTRKLTKN